MVNKIDEITMKLMHYFITEKNYNPVILQGAKNEIWLENLNSDYKIIRIVSNYIHNNEQLNFDLYRSSTIIKKIKKQTFSFSMNTLSIFINLGDNVDEEKIRPSKEMDFVGIKDIDELNKCDNVLKVFPDIITDTKFDEEGVNLFMKITDDIAHKNEENGKRAEEIFAIRKPYVTYALLAINILLFIIMVFVSGDGIYGFQTETLVKFGGNVKSLVLNGEYWRLIASAFLHDGFLHLICNMYALYVLGIQLENFFGKTRFAIIYLFSAITGNLLSLVFADPNVVSIGASGAIFGLFGSLLYFGYYYRVYLGTVLRTQIVPVILINLLFGIVTPGIDNAAHIGGLIGGVFISMGIGVKFKSTKSDMINGMIVSTLYLLFLIYMGFFR
ncbi:MAG: rhomboid family intramembrane serine protease [Firmicutes bacterium]|nr:rhomboid family intramembrane serine protease [Bacillota bacterium]